MDNLVSGFILITIIFLIYNNKKQTVYKPAIYKPVLSDQPVYYNINLRNICSKVKKKCEENHLQEEHDEFLDFIKEKNQNCKEDKFNKYVDSLDLSNKIYDQPRQFYRDNSAYPDKPSYYGDNAFTDKMIHMSLKNKHAINNRARWNKYSFMPFIEEEIETHANSRWWDNQDLEQDF